MHSPALLTRMSRAAQLPGSAIYHPRGILGDVGVDREPLKALATQVADRCRVCAQHRVRR